MAWQWADPAFRQIEGVLKFTLKRAAGERRNPLRLALGIQFQSLSAMSSTDCARGLAGRSTFVPPSLSERAWRFHAR